MSFVCGANAVLEALRASRACRKLLVQRDSDNPRVAEARGLAEDLGIAIVEKTRIALDRTAGEPHHQGLILYTEAFFEDHPDLLSLDARRPRPPILVALDGVTDPRNFGAILRCADVLGADGVLVRQDRSAPLSPAAARASAGAAAHVPIARVPNLVRALTGLAERGYAIVGTVESGGAPLAEADLSGALVFVLGEEGSGIGRLVRETCTRLVTIPSAGHVGSLNVAVAAGIFLYEALRRRAPRSD